MLRFRYIGDGSALLGVPAHDLTDADITERHFGPAALAQIRASGLYAEVVIEHKAMRGGREDKAAPPASDTNRQEA